MKSIAKFILLTLVLLCSGVSYADTHVNGYYKKNGTYVEPHYRTAPNNTNLDNYSTKGNTNPYTGKEGTKYPDSVNQYQPPSKDIEPMKKNNNGE